jgi:hypothetical protein
MSLTERKQVRWEMKKEEIASTLKVIEDSVASCQSSLYWNTLDKSKLLDIGDRLVQMSSKILRCAAEL